MKFKFPFQIAQISENEVQIELIGDEPLVSIDLHPSVRNLVDDDAMDAIYAKAVEGVVRAAIKISH